MKTSILTAKSHLEKIKDYAASLEKSDRNN